MEKEAHEVAIVVDLSVRLEEFTMEIAKLVNSVYAIPDCTEKNTGEFQDIVSLVVYCSTDSTMMLTFDEDAPDYWLPSVKSREDSWKEHVTAVVARILEVSMEPQQILRISKFWLPRNDNPHCVHHVVYGLQIEQEVKDRVEAEKKGVCWVDKDKLSELWENQSLKTPKVIRYYNFMKNFDQLSDGLPDECYVSENIFRIDEKLMTTNKKCNFWKMTFPVNLTYKDLKMAENDDRIGSVFAMSLMDETDVLVGVAEEFHDVVSLVVICTTDKTMLLEPNKESEEYYLPMIVSPETAWEKQAVRIIENLLGESRRPQNIVRICKCWLPDSNPPYVTHICFELHLDDNMRKKMTLKSNSIWVDFDQLEDLNNNRKLKSPELLRYYCLVLNIPMKEYHIAEEYHVNGNFAEVDEDVIETSKTSMYGKMVCSARFDWKVQTSLFKIYLDLVFPAAYMGYHAFCKFLLFAKWRKRNFADYFRSADIYNRHSLSFRDFLYFLAAMEPSTSHTYSIGALRCAYIFRFYNEDGDGKLKPDQFANFLEDVLEVDAGTTFPTESSRVDLRKNCWKTLGVPDTHEFSLTEFQEAVDTLQLEGIAHIFRGPVDICKDTLGKFAQQGRCMILILQVNKMPSRSVET